MCNSLVFPIRKLRFRKTNLLKVTQLVSGELVPADLKVCAHSSLGTLAPGGCGRE